MSEYNSESLSPVNTLFTIETAFNAFGVKALYKKHDLSVTTEVLVIVRQKDVSDNIGFSFIRRETTTIDVSSNQLQNVYENDIFEFDEVEYIVVSKPKRDLKRAVWKVDLNPVDDSVDHTIDNTHMEPIIDASFSSFGIPANHKSVLTEETVSIYVVVRSPDLSEILDFSDVIRPSLRVDVQIKYLPHVQEGDTITINNIDHTVIGKPVRDLKKLFWRIDLNEN